MEIRPHLIKRKKKGTTDTLPRWTATTHDQFGFFSSISIDLASVVAQLDMSDKEKKNLPR